MSRLAKFREEEAIELSKPIWHHYEKTQKDRKDQELAKQHFYQDIRNKDELNDFLEFDPVFFV